MFAEAFANKKHSLNESKTLHEKRHMNRASDHRKQSSDGKPLEIESWIDWKNLIGASFCILQCVVTEIALMLSYINLNKRKVVECRKLQIFDPIQRHFIYRLAIDSICDVTFGKRVREIGFRAIKIWFNLKSWNHGETFE